MAKMREIKGRIRAVGNIQRITKTMQLIATARFQTAVRRATAARPYSDQIAKIARQLAAAAGEVQHPLLRDAPQPAVGRELLLVITSDRGLCGGYNSNVLRTAMDHLRSRAQDEGTDLEVVGKKGHAFFRFNRVPIAAYHTQFTDRPAFADVQALAERYIERFGLGIYDTVKVVYMAFETVGRQRPVLMTLLPLQAPDAQEPLTPRKGAHAQAAVQYEFSPNPQRLLADLLPVTARTRLFQAFSDAAVGEQIARMTAMKAATDAAGDMRRRLGRQFNRARQTAITTELAEIIGGSAALR